MFQLALCLLNFPVEEDHSLWEFLLLESYFLIGDSFYISMAVPVEDCQLAASLTVDKG